MVFRFRPRTKLLALLFAFAAQGAAATAQDVQDVQPIFRAQMALAKAEVFQGRIVCRLDRLTRWANSHSNSRGGGESLRFEHGDRGTSMHYKLLTAERRLTIDAWQDALVMERLVLHDGQVEATTRFEQQPGQRLVLQVGRGERRQLLAADTIWHLWLADSQLCAENLLPLCEMLGMETHWLQFTEALEIKLLRLAEAGSPHDPSDWRLWIDELGDERYAVREAADRRLRATGTSLLPFVRRVDPARLDAEQRFRLRRILHGLQVEVAVDTVDSAAEWLLDDPRVWVELLDRADVAERTSAAAQLGRLLESEIDFDPPADATQRHDQIVRLRERVSRAFDRH